jgi:hypothetical protein
MSAIPIHGPNDYGWWTSMAKAIVGIVQGMTFLHSRNQMHRDLLGTNLIMKMRYPKQFSMIL